MSKQEYIECKVFKGDDGQYCFKYPESEQEKHGVNYYMESFRLSEAVNVPGFDGVQYEDDIPDDWRSISIPCGHVGRPQKVRFRVPVVEKKEPPRCEDCLFGIGDGKYCQKTESGLRTKDGKVADVCMNLTWFERTSCGECGPDGKCFVAREEK